MTCILVHFGWFEKPPEARCWSIWAVTCLPLLEHGLEEYKSSQSALMCLSILFTLSVFETWEWLCFQPSTSTLWENRGVKKSQSERTQTSANKLTPVLALMQNYPIKSHEAHAPSHPLRCRSPSAALSPFSLRGVCIGKWSVKWVWWDQTPC